MRRKGERADLLMQQPAAVGGRRAVAVKHVLSNERQRKAERAKNGERRHLLPAHLVLSLQQAEADGRGPLLLVLLQNRETVLFVRPGRTRLQNSKRWSSRIHSEL